MKDEGEEYSGWRTSALKNSSLFYTACRTQNTVKIETYKKTFPIHKTHFLDESNVSADSR